MEFRYYTHTCISRPAFLSLEYFTKHIPLQSALLPILTESRRISVASLVHVGWAPSVLSSVMNVIFVECRGGEIYHSSCSTCNALVDQCICFTCVFTTWMLFFLCIVVWGLYFTGSILQVWSRWRSNRSCGCRCPLWRPQCWPFIDLFSGKAMGQPEGVISCLFFWLQRGSYKYICAKLGYNCYSNDVFLDC